MQSTDSFQNSYQDSNGIFRRNREKKNNSKMCVETQETTKAILEKRNRGTWVAQ